MTEIKEDKCLFVINQGANFKAVHAHISTLGGFYNGAGWFVEYKHQEPVSQICEISKVQCIDFPLSNESFDDLRRQHKASFYDEKSFKINSEIIGLRSVLNIPEGIEINEFFNEENIKKFETFREGKKIIELAHEKEVIQKRIKQLNEEEALSKLKFNRLPIISIQDRFKAHNAMLERNRGKKYLGLKVKTITEFNNDMLGVRGLILLAAAPNVGKTALTIQLALEVLSENPEACLVYISLEMSEDQIFTRMNLYHSELIYKTYVLGSTQIDSENHYENLFKPEESRKIKLAEDSIQNYGNRLQIIDQKTCPNFNSEMIIAHIQNLKKETGCTRAIVIVDYLQVFPIPESLRLSDIEGDKWRIGEIKKISDALNVDNDDPVIVISEARKPSSSSDAWGGGLSDVMGSARGTYTPDAVLLLSQLEEDALAKLFDKMKIDKFKSLSKDEKEEKPITNFLAKHGMAFCGLKLAKGRDGMTRFNATLVFHFRRNKFENINWSEIRVLK